MDACHRSGQDKINLDLTGQERKSKTRQHNGSRHDKIEQAIPGQDREGQDGAGQDNPGQVWAGWARSELDVVEYDKQDTIRQDNMGS